VSVNVPSARERLLSHVRSLSWERMRAPFDFAFARHHVGGDRMDFPALYVGQNPAMPPAEAEATLVLIERAPLLYRQLRTSQAQMDAALRILIQIAARADQAVQEGYEGRFYVWESVDDAIEVLDPLVEGLRDVTIANEGALS
jgi:hypothetical protein